MIYCSCKKKKLDLIRFLLFAAPKENTIGLKIQLIKWVCSFFSFKTCSHLLVVSMSITFFKHVFVLDILNRFIWWRILWTLWMNSTKRCHLNFSWKWIKLMCILVFSMLLLCCYISFYFVDMSIIGSILFVQSYRQCDYCCSEL